jgi:hypothetical protein
LLALTTPAPHPLSGIVRGSLKESFYILSSIYLSLAALYAGAIAAYRNIPIVTWGTSIATDFAYTSEYPTMIQISAISYSNALVASSVLIQVSQPNQQHA